MLDTVLSGGVAFIAEAEQGLDKPQSQLLAHDWTPFVPYSS